MKIKCQEEATAERKDGNLDAALLKETEGSEALGGKPAICELCGFSGYPECLSDCPAGRNIAKSTADRRLK